MWAETKKLRFKKMRKEQDVMDSRTIHLIKAIENTYKNRKELIIVGLTGCTGAGCSTVAKILQTKGKKKLNLYSLKEYGYKNSDERKNYVVQKYMMHSGHWKYFYCIEVSSIILLLVLANGVDRFCSYIKRLGKNTDGCSVSFVDKENVIITIKGLKEICEEVKKFNLEGEDNLRRYNDMDEEEKGKFLNFYTNRILEIKELVQKKFTKLSCYEIKKDADESVQENPFNFYTFIMQKIGQNLRCYGVPFPDKKSQFTGDNTCVIAKYVDKVIECIRECCGQSEVRICIDAIRNPYEAVYFRDKYKQFYLISVSADERLGRLGFLEEKELTSQDNVENAIKISHEEEFYRQNIRACAEIADIHIFNQRVENGRYYTLTEQLLKYLALILHPGLITPTAVERCMQLAYNIKFNSGCLSRQVGAVVTRSDYSIQSVGWNDVPKGQVPCNLRDINRFVNNHDKESFSEFELTNDEFCGALECLKEKCSFEDKLLDGLCFAYCFKDVYNGIKKDRNQVFTRSLHAEENAFLQISKYGGGAVSGGYLFTTASPCELCAKKAYQLGISKIYFIDPYPGISMQHILKFGNDSNPQVVPFVGVIGEKYIDLYRSRIAYKDEIEMITGIDVKKEVQREEDNLQWKYGEIVFEESFFQMKLDRELQNVEFMRKVNMTLKSKHKEKENSFFIHNVNWLGVETTCIDYEKDKFVNCNLEILKNTTPYKIKSVFNTHTKSINYKFSIKGRGCKDVMEPQIVHVVKHKTQTLILRLVIPKTKMFIKDGTVKCSIYADTEMEKIYYCKENIRGSKNKDGDVVYEFKITGNDKNGEPAVKPNYVYALEWEWK